MEPKSALDEHVRRKLEDTFGKAVAMLIEASANRTAAASILDPDRDGYLRFVDAICADQRCLDMWGRAGADQMLRQWRSLV